MKPNHHPKLKTPPRPLFSCAFFRHCTQASLSPTTPTPPPLPSPSPPPPPPPPPPTAPSPPQPPTKKLSSSSSSSSASTSQSFTQWKFPLPTSPPPPPPHQTYSSPCDDGTLLEIFHTVELHLASSNPQTQLSAFRLLERSLLTDHAPVTCPHSLMRAIVSHIRSNNAVVPNTRRSAAKILLSLCLAEPNRRVAVEAGAVGAVVEGAVEMAEEGAAAAERALAALELMCTVGEGAGELRGHALAVPAMVGVMGRVEGRGREHAMGVLAVVFRKGGRKEAEEEEEAQAGMVAEEVAKAVELALKGECSERGRRKGQQLLKLLKELKGDGECRASLSQDSDWLD